MPALFGKQRIISQEGFIGCFGDCGTSLPLIDGEVERVLAVLTLVNQPDVQTIAIGVDAEFVCVSKVCLSAAARTAANDTKRFGWNDFIFSF